MIMLMQVVFVIRHKSCQGKKLRRRSQIQNPFDASLHQLSSDFCQSFFLSFFLFFFSSFLYYHVKQDKLIQKLRIQSEMNSYIRNIWTVALRRRFKTASFASFSGSSDVHRLIDKHDMPDSQAEQDVNSKFD